MRILDWAESAKPDLVRLQDEHGIPAMWAAVQACHESYDIESGGLTDLARLYHNYGGLKWAEWQRPYGCRPARFGTWEVIDGQAVDVDDAFCTCPSWEVWLRVYAALLTGERYGKLLKYAAAPLLYGFQVAQAGYATDPHYIFKAAGWMTVLWGEYADTLPRPPSAKPSVAIKDRTGALLCTGFLDAGRTVAPVRPLATALGLRIEWQAPGEVRLSWPGGVK